MFCCSQTSVSVLTHYSLKNEDDNNDINVCLQLNIKLLTNVKYL
jgi:hypothetical protein